MGIQRRRPHPGAHRQLRQRAARGHDDRRADRRLQVRSCAEPDDRAPTVYMPAAGHHPQHAPRVQLQRRRRRRVSELGAPEGRYFAPANSADCIQLRAGDCAPRTLLVRAPFFTRFDIGLTKRFPIKDQVNFELRFDVLNVFDNVNFLPHATVANNQPGAGATSSRPHRPIRISTTTSTRAAGSGRSVPVELVASGFAASSGAFAALVARKSISASRTMSN